MERGVRVLRGKATARVFRAALLSLFNKSGKGPPNHPLDSEVHEYHKVINEIVIPTCMQLAPDVNGYSERIKQLILYTNPAFGDAWNFGVELAYRLVAPPRLQTAENLVKARLLRAALDLSFTMTAVLDDVTDGSEMRRNKKAWHKVCPGAEAAAVYDGSVMGYLPFFLLTKYFKAQSGYSLMMEKFAQANTRSLVGQSLDVRSHGSTPSADTYGDIVNYKAGHLVSLQPALGLLHAGILDETLIDQVSNIFQRFGTLIQIWDDFSEYFCHAEESGKPYSDFHNAGTTWVSSTALPLFTPGQRDKFKGAYGSAEPIKVEEAKKLLDDIDLSRRYMEHMRNSYYDISTVIDRLVDVRLRNVCYSYMDWLIGDVRSES